MVIVPATVATIARITATSVREIMATTGLTMAATVPAMAAITGLTMAVIAREAIIALTTAAIAPVEVRTIVRLHARCLQATVTQCPSSAIITVRSLRHRGVRVADSSARRSVPSSVSPSAPH